MSSGASPKLTRMPVLSVTAHYLCWPKNTRYRSMVSSPGCSLLPVAHKGRECKRTHQSLAWNANGTDRAGHLSLDQDGSEPSFASRASQPGRPRSGVLLKPHH